MFRAGFFANAASVAGFLSEEKSIGGLFTGGLDHESLCGTIDRTKGATRTFFFIDEQRPVILEQEPL
jgi:hypothetical protein